MLDKTAEVEIQGKLKDKIPIKLGLKQGYGLLSPATSVMFSMWEKLKIISSLEWIVTDLPLIILQFTPSNHNSHNISLTPL